MQTLSLEDEFRRMDGVPYTIDFYWDFSTAVLGNPDNKMCVQEIVEEIMNPKVIDVGRQSDTLCLEDRRQDEEFWRGMDKMIKKEARREKKWKKHNKKVTAKQAYKNFKHVYKEIMRR